MAQNVLYFSVETVRARLRMLCRHAKPAAELVQIMLCYGTLEELRIY
jgi:hypothetical protein